MFEEVLFTTNKDSFFLKIVKDKNTFYTTAEEIAKLFNVAKLRVTNRLKEIYQNEELDRRATTKKIKEDDKIIELYSLEALITLSYKIDTTEAIKFRKTFTGIVERFMIKGYVLNNDNLKSNMKFADDYFEELLKIIDEIRISKREIYQKITDIFAHCSYDYDKNSEIATEFYLRILGKLEYLSEDDKSERNYLYHAEIKTLENIVEAYLDFAEYKANTRALMSMNDWIDKFDSFLDFNESELLKDREKIDITKSKVRACLESSI